MTAAASLVPCGHDHVVAVYDVDDELVTAVAAFLSEALAQGGAAVVIATDAHRRVLDAALEAQGHPLEVLIATGQYRSLDASATLAAFMRDDRPDADKFASVIGAVLDEVARSGGPVRLFGEMVGLLWEDGNLAGAIELETLWNDVAVHHTFALFCAYAMSSLETSGDLTAVKRMCDRHSGVLALHASNWRDCDRVVAAGREHYVRLFVATPTVLREVRHFVREALHIWGDGDLGSTAEVVASELATNAVQHARSPFCVSISRSSAAIGIEVRDTSFDPPEHLRQDAGHAGGRGVRLIAALSRAWGTRDEVDGKTVWAEVARTSIG
ncbi:MAG: MEDS domain-containing protein [Acidimicrobiia bacterium]